MPHELLHRPARDSDLDAVHAILNHPFVNHQLSFDAVPRERFPVIFSELCAGGDFRVVESAGRLIATYRIQRGTHRLAHSAHLGCVAVHPECQAQGMGRRIIGAVLDELRSAGLHRVDLTVAADNPRGIAFWTAVGFTIEGRFKDYFVRAGYPGYGEEVAMAIILTARPSSAPGSAPPSATPRPPGR